MAECPECSATVDVVGAVKGEKLPCPECDTDLELVAMSPVALAVAPDEDAD